MFDSDDHFDSPGFDLDLDSDYFPPAGPPTRPIDPTNPLIAIAQEETPKNPPGQPIGSSTIISPHPQKSGPEFPTVDGLFPRCSINLLAGSSFSGRTRFILPQFDHYAAGLFFLNKPVPKPPEQLGMIFCSRDGEDIRDRIEQLGLKHLRDPKVFPVARWSGRIRDQSEYYPTFPLEKCYADLTDAAGEEPRFLLIDGIQKLAPVNKISEYHAVCEFFDALREWCKWHHCTVLGTTLKAKAKQGTGYETLPEQIYGSVVWADNASCVMGIDRYSDTSTIRKITVLSKAAYGEVEPLWADFRDGGRLELISPPDGAQKFKQTKLDQILLLEKEGTEYAREDLLKWGEDEEVGKRTVAAWIGGCVKGGILLRRTVNGKVIYSKPLAN